LFADVNSTRRINMVRAHLSRSLCLLASATRCRCWRTLPATHRATALLARLSPLFAHNIARRCTARWVPHARFARIAA